MARRKILFTTRRHPKTGVISVVIAGISIFFLLVLFLLSGMEGGKSDIWIGFFGTVILIASMIGFIMALRCYKKDDIYMTTPAFGSAANGVVIVVMMILYIIGTN